MANIEKIITDIIEDNEMRLKTPTGKSNTEYYQTKIDVCNQILEKVRREKAESEQSNCTIPDVSGLVCLHEWDEGFHNVSKCKKCGKYSA